jgi:hypothetical protein
VSVALGEHCLTHFGCCRAGEREPCHELALADRVTGRDARRERKLRGVLRVVRNLGQSGRYSGLVVVLDHALEHAETDGQCRGRGERRDRSRSSRREVVTGDVPDVACD